MREAAEKDEAERQAFKAQKSWSEWLGSYWTNMEYNHSNIPASTFDDCNNNDLVPTPSAGVLVPIVNLRAGQTTHGEESEFKRRRVSNRGRMSTNYIWQVLFITILMIC